MSTTTSPAPGDLSSADIRKSIDRHLLAGAGGACALIAALAISAAVINFAGAVVAPGRLVVASSVKQIQSSVGGTVTTISVADGDHVAAGDLLLRLDPTTAAANLAGVTKAIDSIRVQEARLRAEESGAATIAFPDDLLARTKDADLTNLMAVATAEFLSRRADRDSEKSQLGKRIAELDQQLGGIKAQQTAVSRQLALTKDDLASYQSLQAQGLMSNSQVSTVARLVAEYEGQMGQLAGAAGETGAQIAEANLQITQIDAQFRSQVTHDLNDVEAKLADLRQHEISARNELVQFDMRAPQEGTVYQLAVHTIGGVVAPGQTVMEIVPTHDALEVEARIDPGRVDQIHPGSSARLRFSSLGARTTPEFTGVVDVVSPDVIVDERTGAAYFRARIKMPEAAAAVLGKGLVPGVPVEVFVSTGDRSALSYLVRPLTDQFAFMFRER